MQEPTIKGIFVNSHIKNLKKQKGEEGIEELRKRYGKSIEFRNSENVPVREEVKIIEIALQILTNDSVPKDQIAFEAGKLHFKDFVTTPLAKIIFSLFRNNFKLMMLQSKNIAGHVFNGVKFSSEELGPKQARVIMENNDYPIDHFRGLFQEWMDYSGLTGVVKGKLRKDGSYEYLMTWQ
ncbi:DUF2378 family protein [Candidatus Daviesbacteria bacterium]|nr:DUF2378 family protein [Candidatus Daviesbacteria bacterium]